MTVADILIQNYAKVFPAVVGILLKILAALIVVIVGWLVAWLVDNLIRVIVERLRLNEVLKRYKIGKYFENVQIVVKLEEVLGFAAFWLVFGLFLMAAFDILGLAKVNEFIGRVISYIPVALVGALILLISFFFGEVVKKMIYLSLKGTKIKAVEFISGLAKWSIVVFGLLMALSEWGVASDLVNILLSGVIAFFVLAGGLAFGLGGQEVAREILENLRRDLRNR